MKIFGIFFIFGPWFVNEVSTKTSSYFHTAYNQKMCQAIVKDCVLDLMMWKGIPTRLVILIRQIPPFMGIAYLCSCLAKGQTLLIPCFYYWANSINTAVQKTDVKHVFYQDSFYGWFLLGIMSLSSRLSSSLQLISKHLQFN